jgi:hypothetical protein
VILEKPDKDAEAKKEPEDRPATAPSLRRPGEDSEDVPKSGDASPLPPSAPPSMPAPPGGGPPDLIAGND